MSNALFVQAAYCLTDHSCFGGNFFLGQFAFAFHLENVIQGSALKIL